MVPSTNNSPYTAALAKIKKRAGNDPVLNEIAKEEDPQMRMEREKNCEVIHKIMRRCADNYRKGEYSFTETCNMICAALKKVK